MVQGVERSRLERSLSNTGLPYSARVVSTIHALVRCSVSAMASSAQRHKGWENEYEGSSNLVHRLV
jgi:hypothetical protein